MHDHAGCVQDAAQGGPPRAPSSVRSRSVRSPGSAPRESPRERGRAPIAPPRRPAGRRPRARARPPTGGLAAPRAHDTEDPSTGRIRCFTVVVRRLVIVLAVLVVAAFVAAVARGLQFRGAAKPGVHVVGIDVGGKSRSQIESQLRSWSARAVTIRPAATPITSRAAGSSRSMCARPRPARLPRGRPSPGRAGAGRCRAGRRARQRSGRRARARSRAQTVSLCRPR